jgi:hypothetical protein
MTSCKNLASLGVINADNASSGFVVAAVKPAEEALDTTACMEMAPVHALR